MTEPIANDLTIVATGVIDGVQMAGATVLTLRAVTPPEPTPEPTPPPTTDKLRAVIDYEGRAYVFDEIAGEDLGVYREPGGRFSQGCVRVEHPDLTGLVVQFRADPDGSRDEVVFELGDTTAGNVAANMAGYVATISRGPTTLAKLEVPQHYWYSRWRWQSAPRPVCASLAELIAEGLVPSYDETLASNRPRSPARTYSPMGLAGLTAYMPSTGERDEIGLFTEAQAEYLCTADATSLGSMLAQAEASGTLTWHYRDEIGGGIFDFVTHPQATLYGTPTIPWCKSDIVLDVAHEPSLCFLPFLLTGDPYYLEEVQFAATYNVICNPPAAREKFCIGNAVRAHAWALRTLAQATTVTPDDVPCWLKPASYWKAWLDKERDWMLATFVNATAAPPIGDPFHFLVTCDGSPAGAMPAGCVVQTYMEDYEGAVLAWVVAAGHSDWMTILEWKMCNTLARTNGTSGWCRAKPVLYNTALRPAADAPYVETWADAWALNEAMQSDTCAYDDENAIPPGDSLTYASYCNASLAIAATLGVEGAAECTEWLSGQIRANSKANKYIDRKWAITATATY
jgi:hypothetical protein